MKKSNFSKIVIMILSLALLVGSVFALSAGATEETEETGAVEILAQNVAYTDNITVLYAVNATIEDAIAGNVKVSYYWEKDGAAKMKAAKLLYPYDEDGAIVESYVYPVKNEETGETVNYPVFYTEGVAAKDLDKVACVVAYDSAEIPEDATYKTYSVVEYLYSRLYKNGIVNATEGEDLLRKNVYVNLLAYGASAQELLLNYGKDDADKVALITDYSYAYTTVAGVSINGAKTAIGAGELELTLSYVGEGTLVGWTLTDASGEATEYETSTVKVSGIVSVEPIFGVHECVDVAPADHLCDVCGETVSECADSEDSDHLCDVCGKVIEGCNDADGNGACDECGIYAFENDITSGVSLYTFTSTGNANATQQTSITATSTGVGYYGVLASRVQDPADAANNVMKIVINGGTNNSNTSGLTTYLPHIDIYASSKVVGGNIHVFEYDFYAERFNKAGVRNFMTLYAYDTAGNKGLLQNGGADTGTNGHTKSLAQVTGTTPVANSFQVGVGSTQSENSSYALFDSHTWYRFRFVYNATNGTIDTYVSFDKGENWYVAAAQQTTTSLSTAGVDTANISHLAFSFTTWGHGEIFYVDNANYYVTDTAPTAHSESGIDSVEALYR